MICDNYGTHNHSNVKRWLAKYPRFQLHFTPTSSSWLNLVERWFRDLTDKAIRRGVFHSVDDLVTAIEDYLKANNDNPKPFVWTATVEQILAQSMQLVARDAVREYVERRQARADVTRETEWAVEQYREALQRLGTL